MAEEENVCYITTESYKVKDADAEVIQITAEFLEISGQEHLEGGGAGRDRTDA